MTILRWNILLLVLLCSIALVPAAMAKEITMTPAGSLAGVASVHDNYPISEERAMLLVKDFVGDFTLELEPDDVEWLPVGNYYTFYADEDHFWVNQQSGDVEFAHFTSNYKNSALINLSRDQAFAAAQSYAVEKYAGFKGNNWLWVEDKLVNSTAGSEYSFTWREFIGVNDYRDGVGVETNLPNIVHVSVNANNGKVIDYWGINRILSASTKPAILMSEALATAEGSVPDDITVSHPAISLSLAERSHNVETLVWVVKFDGTRGTNDKIPVTVYVNAGNGRIIRDMLWVDSWLE